MKEFDLEHGLFQHSYIILNPFLENLGYLETMSYVIGKAQLTLYIWDKFEQKGYRT